MRKKDTPDIIKKKIIFLGVAKLLLLKELY